jgi:hypothetical protein
LKKSVIILALCLFPALPLFAKDKEYRDATLIKVSLERPTKSEALQGISGGFVAQKTWWFEFQVGDLKYFGWCDKGKVKEGEWQNNTPVKIWFEVKGGGVATRTWIHLLNDKGKETELEVTGIFGTDDHNLCGTRKCDPESAEKKKLKGE